MAKVIMYTKDSCAYCVHAKTLLQKKNISYQELRIDLQPELAEEMIAKSGRRTVPQIFINGQAIGGYSELYALEQQGQLDNLINNFG